MVKIRAHRFQNVGVVEKALNVSKDMAEQGLPCFSAADEEEAEGSEAAQQVDIRRPEKLVLHCLQHGALHHARRNVATHCFPKKLVEEATLKRALNEAPAMLKCVYSDV